MAEHNIPPIYLQASPDLHRGLEYSKAMCEHRRLTNSFRYAVRATRVDQGKASRNVHDTKVATGRGGADNVIFCLDCGAIIVPETHEVIGNLFD